MLYELALGQVEQWEIAPSFETLLENTAINFIHGQVDSLDLADKSIDGIKLGTSDDHKDSFRISFDRAILATGAKVAGISSVPGAEEFAIPFYSLSDAHRLKAKLQELKSEMTPGTVCNVIVVGGGFSGVEIASCLADDLGTSASVLIVETSDQLLRKGTDHNRETSKRALIDNGVVVQYSSMVQQVTAESVTIEQKEGDTVETVEYPANLVIWTAGSTPNPTSAIPDIATDKFGRIDTDSFLRVKDYEDVLYALGDVSCTPTGDGYYGTAQVAVQQAEYAAWNTWASLCGKPKLEYRYTHLGEMMVLGEFNGTVTTTVGLELEGRAAWIARRLGYLARMPTDRHRARVAASWAAHPLLTGMGDLVKESRKYRTQV